MPQAAAWVVADLDSGEVLASRGAHTALAPASTLKVLTALAVAPRLELDDVYTARDDDAAIDGSKVGLVPGSRYTVNDLLHGLLLGSGNDCANALANLVGGRGPFRRLITAEAERLGAEDTVALTPTGLDAPGQVSSAYDLALATRAALGDRRLAKIMATTTYKFPAEGTSLGRKRTRFEIQNHNKLLRNFAGATGGKTGYTDAARHSFIGSAERGGSRYVVTLLRGEGIPWQQAGKLLDWAFATGAKAQPVGELVAVDTVAAEQSDGPGAGGGQARAREGSPLSAAAAARPGGPGSGSLPPWPLIAAAVAGVLILAGGTLVVAARPRAVPVVTRHGR